MGTGNGREIKFYLKEADGRTLEIQPDFTEVKFCSGQDVASIGKVKCEFSVRMKIPKSMRCGSRKRFVKLLMGSGIQRNAARMMAELSVVRWNKRDVPDSLKESYQSYFTELWLRCLVRQ